MSEVKSIYRVLAYYLKQTSRLGGECNDKIRRSCGIGLHLRTSYYCMVQYVQ